MRIGARESRMLGEGGAVGEVIELGTSIEHVTAWSLRTVILRDAHVLAETRFSAPAWRSGVRAGRVYAETTRTRGRSPVEWLALVLDDLEVLAAECPEGDVARGIWMVHGIASIAGAVFGLIPADDDAPWA